MHKLFMESLIWNYPNWSLIDSFLRMKGFSYANNIVLTTSYMYNHLINKVCMH